MSVHCMSTPTLHTNSRSDTTKCNNAALHMIFPLSSVIVTGFLMQGVFAVCIAARTTGTLLLEQQTAES